MYPVEALHKYDNRTTLCVGLYDILMGVAYLKIINEQEHFRKDGR